MEDCDRALILGISEITEEGGELGPGEQSLVDDGATGERADVEMGQMPLVRSSLHLSSREIEGTLPGVLVRCQRGTPHQHLPDHRARRERGRAQCRGIGRHVAPAQEWDPIVREHLLDHPHRLAERLRIARQEEGADPEGQARLQVQSQSVRVAIEEPMRDLGEEACPVS